MKLKIYNFLVNRHSGIKQRYDRFRSRSGSSRIVAWLYLFWLNFAYYVLFCHFLDLKMGEETYESKELMVDISESSVSPKMTAYVEKLSQYDVVSFDIFDTLIFRPFSEPTDLFYFIGEKINYMDFKSVRIEAEMTARHRKYEAAGTYEVTLVDIWKVLEEMTGISAEKGIQIEEELELQFCYANPFMKKVYDILREQGKKIIIVSDMYLSAQCLAKILEKNGFIGYEKLYVSCEYDKNKGTGQLFQLVHDELQLQGQKVIHIGDNENSDVQKPQKYGFDSYYYPNVNKWSRKYRAYDMSPIIGGAYRGIVNNHLYCGKHKHSMEYEYGYTYGGLFVVGYCNYIHEYCKNNKIDKVLFLSRDGDILYQVYTRLYPQEKAQYVYWSRKVSTKLMACADRYDYIRRFLQHKTNQGVTIRKAFESMEVIDSIDFSHLPFDLDMEITSSNLHALEQFVLENWNNILAVYEQEHAAAKQYYGEVLAGCKKAVAVDIGWAGSGAFAINHLANNVWGLSCEIIGLVAGTNTIHNDAPDASETFLQSGKMASYMYSMSHNRDLMKKHNLHRDYNIFWELLLSSPKPQFVGFDLDEKTDEVKLRFGKTDANPDGIRQVQAGILDFAKEYVECFGHIPYMFQISGRDAYAPMMVAASKNEKYLKKMKARFDLIAGVE